MSGDSNTQPNRFDFTAPQAFPTVWDNTMRAEFVSCPKSFFYSFLHGVDIAVPSVHLHAGGVFAKALEKTRRLYYTGQCGAEVAVANGLRELYSAYGDFDAGDSAKSVDRLAGALEFYFERWPLETDTAKPVNTAHGPAVEFNFVLPIPEVIHPESGEPILYSGRFDMLADFNGAIYVEDDKTTTSLGASWANQWKLRSQFTGYVWGARQFGYDVRGAIIRGVSILKTKYDSAEVIVYRPEWMIEQWYAQLVRDLQRAKECYAAGIWDVSLADACSSYGGCPFLRLCESPEPEVWANGPTYRLRRWDPTNPYAEDSPGGK
jgi:hypothetical protein